MSNELYFDFDQAMEEASGQTMTVKAFGEKYELPGDLPFDIVLKISRRHKEGAKEMSDDDMVQMANQLFGEDVFQAWLKKGIGLRGIMTMIEGVMKLYMNRSADTSTRMVEDKLKKANP